MPRHALIGLAVLPLLLSVPAQAQVRARNAAGLDRETQAQVVLDTLGPEHVVREAWRKTTRYFYEQEALPQGWEAIRDRYVEKSRSARTPEQVHHVINQMLGETKTSHLALMERRVFLRELYNEFRNEPEFRAGCELELVDGRLFVGGVAEGGPAEAAGLKSGDEVLAIDDQPARTSPRLDPAGHDPGIPGNEAFFLRVRDQTPLALQVRRTREGAPQTCTIRPRETTLIESMGNSARVVQHQGKRIGVIHLWHFMTGAVVRTLADAIQGELADADALVLDVRGRGGRADVVRRILNLFSGRRPTWTKPVVCLIDKGSRSAKEIFAYHWKKREIGPLIGERTAGACIGCTFVQLSDSSILMVPMSNVSRMTDGVNLEGVGVAPTEPVDQHPLPYRQGRDAILAAGLKRAALLATVAEGDAVPVPY
jgi:carboxyl-terminal processing protease